MPAIIPQDIIYRGLQLFEHRELHVVAPRNRNSQLRNPRSACDYYRDIIEAERSAKASANDSLVSVMHLSTSIPVIYRAVQHSEMLLLDHSRDLRQAMACLICGNKN